VDGYGVVVSGGSSGLGAAVVRRFHERGAQVTIADVNSAAGAELAGELGERSTFVACDVRHEDQVAAAVAQAATAPAGLRVAVACAGVGVVEAILGHGRTVHRQESFEATLAVNLVGSFNVLRIAARAIAETSPEEDGARGVVVLTSSLSGIEGAPGEVAYAASKAGVVGMVLPAARELAAVGIRVNAIAPGAFDTPMMDGMSDPLKAGYVQGIPFPKRFGRPEEFAALVEHVVSNRVVNGATLRIDGGARHR
jgi:NAD(P)-dependent dehydrogenase (short-subunit alcohol dehydrogenase family)